MFHGAYPIGSMYGIFTYVDHKNQSNVGRYTKRGSYMGMRLRFENLRCSFNVHKRNAMSMSECALSTYV